MSVLVNQQKNAVSPMFMCHNEYKSQIYGIGTSSIFLFFFFFDISFHHVFGKFSKKPLNYYRLNIS